MEFILSLIFILCSLAHVIQSQISYFGNTKFLEERNQVSITIDYENDIVEITFIGQDAVWNGIGFGQNVMNATYSIIMDYNEIDPVIYETILGHHDAGTQIDTNITTISDETVGDTRRVTMTTPIDSDYYSFPPDAGAPTMDLPLIASIGGSNGFFILNLPHTSSDRESLTLTLTRSGTTTSSPMTTSGTNISLPMTTSGIHPCCECVDDKRCKGCKANMECENIICEHDSYCCYRKWDLICVIQADVSCNGNEIPTCCACTRKMSMREKVSGCANDEQCEKEICDTDAFCCSEDERKKGYWDHKCRNTAKHICRAYHMESKKDKDTWE